MFTQRLKDLRKEKSLTQKELSQILKVSQQTIGSWEVGRAEPSTEMLDKLCEFFGVSYDYILGKTDTRKPPYYELSEQEKSDIAVQADQLLEGIESGDDLSFYGEPATEEQKERLRIAIRTAMEMNKEEAKKKFTPKKYRD
ncbi:helix-turn-helix domain-containing protein [Tetragenococcus halophilus]|uniref:Helix-turn-helix transcriptional regulator n=1 Tax=Tetragenococcus halophilus TaxID=51669 RepID=A0AB35HM75_TETHA|nr:helix-turn-helix transcriptional regulator [Tetragenococcus halophilus]MCO8297331.1 helix-turn-helix transcriptional regulator [Tetragenococcus halophilus]